jgi:hypothetical protein
MKLTENTESAENGKHGKYGSSVRAVQRFIENSCVFAVFFRERIGVKGS